MSKNNHFQLLKYLSLITYIGISMAVSILIGYYIGNYLMYLTGSFLLFIIFVLLGIAAGFWSIYKIIVKL